MQFAEAFERLGYSVEAPRQDWSAQNDRGVCSSLWRKELAVRDGLLWMNTRVHADDLDGWRDKPGNRKRIRHLKRAFDEFGGRDRCRYRERRAGGQLRDGAALAC
jgi:hypothetical protein